MEYYQFNILISQNADQNKIDSIFGLINSFLKEEGEVFMGRTQRVTLAYPIKKETKAWLISIKFLPKNNEKKWLTPLKLELDKNSEILRYLILKKEEVKEKVKKRSKVKKEKVNIEEVEQKIEEILKE